jgi:RNA polymerase sigma-70 factor (ECF subfamily)
MSIEEQTDQELVRECLTGKQAAFSELVRRHQDSVFGLAVSMTRNREDAADMAQDAFIKAYNKLELYNPNYSFQSWVLSICANLTKNLFRKRTNRRNSEKKHLIREQIEQDTVSPDFQALEDALDQLPPKLGAPLRLKYIEGLSYDQISEVLRIGVSAAKMRVLRAKNQLVEIMMP